jgi:hypothetical protein
MANEWKQDVKNEFSKVKAPQSLYDFANQVPYMIDMAEVNKITERPKKFKKAPLIGFVAAAACCGIFVFGINQSKTFAQYISKIPFLSQISEQDNSIEKAVNNGYVTEISKTARDEGITVTIDKVVADTKRATIFYHMDLDKSIENVKSNVKSLALNNYQVFDGDNHLLFEEKAQFYTDDQINRPKIRPMGGGEADEIETKGNKERLSGMMQIVSTDYERKPIPKELKISVESFVLRDYVGYRSINNDKYIKGNWQVSFKLNPKKPLVYDKPKEFTIQAGSRQLNLTLNYTKVFPTLTELSMDLQNDFKPFVAVFYTYHLENENGKVYKHFDDQVMTDSGDVSPYFESSYFDKPKKLYLVIDKVTTSTRQGGKDIEEVFDVNKKIELTD